ncbi:MAG: peroxide stress protein YaaA [Actinobacteria bacterium]|nr:peroxide stress protein YaaA [Actinomycetota bacterium]
MDPLVLIPPSEGKASGGVGPPWRPATMAIDLDHQRLRVMAALRSAMRANVTARAKLLGVKGDALAAATAANRDIADAPTMPAIERFTGVLYGALDLASLPAAARRRAESMLVIPSGVFGLVVPSDPIPDHKLKMGVSLGGLGRLSSWWREPLTDTLRERCEGRQVWNLLPREHAAAVALVGVPQLRATFLEPNSAGDLVAVSHWNKLLKGALARHLVEHPSTGPAELAAWTHPSGFRLDPSLTTEQDGTTDLCFVRI